MVGILTLLFLVVPLVELFLIVQVSSLIGGLPTIAILLVMSVAGGWLMKREGLGVFRRVQRQIGAGEVPGQELVDGFLILLGGALMLTPGFLTDVIGLSLLLPPVRAVVRRLAARRFTAVAVGGLTGGLTGRRPGGGPGVHERRDGGRPRDGVIDV